MGGGFRGSQIQKYVESVKRLDRWAPNFAHMCRFICEWIYAKQIAPRDTSGLLGGGVLGDQQFKCMRKRSDWHQLWFASADSSGNGHRLNTSRPQSPPGGISGVLGGHKFKSLGKLSNGWTNWHRIWYTSADSSGNGHRLNTIRPSISQGHFGFFRGSHIQKSREDVKRLVRLASHLVHRFIWEWIYAKQIALRDTSGALGGF